MAGRSFLEVAREWYRVRGPRPACEVQRIKKYILPELGGRQIETILPADVLRACRAAEGLGYVETAWRVKGTISLIFRFAVASGYVGADPSASIGDALRPKRRNHYPAVTTGAEVARLTAAIKAYPFPVMRAALLFSLLTFARPGEVRAAEWAEIQGEAWRVPAGKTKTGAPHIVPLSRQALALLGALRLLSGGSRWLFPGGDEGHIGEGGPRSALRRLGFSVTPHSFRGTASTVLNEMGFTPDAIECQLGHKSGTVRAAYNHAQYLPERRRLMQAWADWLDAPALP